MLGAISAGSQRANQFRDDADIQEPAVFLRGSGPSSAKGLCQLSPEFAFPSLPSFFPNIIFKEPAIPRPVSLITGLRLAGVRPFSLCLSNTFVCHSFESQRSLISQETPIVRIIRRQRHERIANPVHTIFKLL